MPEGDTLLVTARVLARALTGSPVIESVRDARLGGACDFAGRTVVGVEARGKNLLVHFDDGRVLRTHLMMTGSWHLYRPGERFRLPAHRARLVLKTADWWAVCFAAPVVEELRAVDLHRHPQLATLGPDILTDAFDAVQARENLKAFPDEPLGVALMRQRAVAGIGNIWRCETLFLLGLDPFRPVRERDDAVLDETLATARRLMQDSAAPYGGSRPGLGRPRMNVHDRAGQLCFRCGGTISARSLGDPPRSLFHCPSCQMN
jgi:endonuclease-8